MPLTRGKATRHGHPHKAVTLSRPPRGPHAERWATHGHRGRSIPADYVPMHPDMSNVDAVRTLADEHHLEYVDLERFNVDTSVSSVIPVAVARKHHVVPIGRRFGSPVVAMSNPGDVMAIDVLRAVIGREFVAVVASDEQIDVCLSRVYGEAPGGIEKGKPAAAVLQPDRMVAPSKSAADRATPTSNGKAPAPAPATA